MQDNPSNSVCSVQGCDKPTVARLLCRKHYSRWHRHGDAMFTRSRRLYPADMSCTVPDCNRNRFERGWCRAHYRRWYKYGSIDGGLNEVGYHAEPRHDYFREITTSTQAYILGMLAADGNVTISPRPIVAISLAEKDVGLIEFIRSQLCPNANIQLLNKRRVFVIRGQTFHRSCQVSLRVRSKEMVNDLIRRHVTPAKTYTLMWPVVPQEFERDLLLGYFDGDGSATSHKSETGRIIPVWTVCSASKPVIEAIATLVMSSIGIRLRQYKNRGIYYAVTSHTKARTIDRWLHASGLGLERKRIGVRFPEQPRLSKWRNK